MADVGHVVVVVVDVLCAACGVNHVFGMPAFHTATQHSGAEPAN